MQCPHCGSTLRDTAVFCSYCGQRVTAQTIQTRVPARGEDDAGDDPASTPGMGAPAGGYSGAGPSAYGANAGPMPSGGQPQGGFGQGASPGPMGGRAQPAGLGGTSGRTRAGGAGFEQLGARLGRLVRLDTSVFRELRDDPAALLPGVVIAAVATLIMAFGGWLWGYAEIGDFYPAGRVFVRSVIVGTALALALWAAWVFVASFVLRQTFRRGAPFQQLLAPMGVAMLPLAFGLLMFIDPLRVAAGVIAVVGAALLAQVALQESTDGTTGEVFVANLAGFLVWAVILALLGGSTRDWAPGIWLFG